MSVRNILWTLIFGVCAGLSISLYFLGLHHCAQNLSAHPGITLLLPLAFLFLVFIRRQSDFFPTSFLNVREASVSETQIWSPWTAPLNLVLSWISHAAGASLGRESTAVTVSASLINIFKLDWVYWRPIVLSASFAMATGYPLIAFLVIIELFFSSSEQKLFSIICAWVGCLVLKSLAVPPMFNHSSLGTDNKGFFSALIFVIAVGIVAGYLGRFYKFFSDWLKRKFQNFRTKKQIFLGFLVTFILTFILIKFNLSAYQSLSLPQFDLILAGTSAHDFFLIKAALTLFFVALGFIGGEFVPSLLIGSSIGVILAAVFSENQHFGFAIGLFAFFAAISKLKWTALGLVWAYFDFSTAMWAYFAISLADSFSGDKKLF